MAKSSPKKPDASSHQKVICKNRRALHDFTIQSRLEAGMVLAGTEVKSCRAGQAHLNNAYIQVLQNEAVLVGASIATYSKSHHVNHVPTQTRKLLLHRHEIDKLAVRLQEKGYTAIPLSMYFKNGYVKVAIGIGQGKRHVDRREDIKRREADRDIARALRRGQRR